MALETSKAVLVNGHPVDGVHRIVEKMGVDLRLEHGDLSIALLLRSLAHLAHQGVDIIHHGVETACDNRRFLGHARTLRNAHVQVAPRCALHGGGNRIHRARQ